MTEHGQYWYSTDRDALLKRLRRVEGQVRGIQRMVDEDEYCIDILTQISAANKALRAVALHLLEGHLGHCVADATAAGVDAPMGVNGKAVEAKVKEATEAIGRLMKS